jgi:Fe-S-cluster containining protein
MLIAVMSASSSNPDQHSLATLSRAYERYGLQASDWIEEFTQQGGTVHCKSGCLHCCNLPIRVSLLEALLTVSQLSDLQLEAMQIRAREILENARVASSWDDYFLSHRQKIGYCPLLDQTTGACTAYEVRPGRCRDTYSAMNAHFCTVGTLENLNRRERSDYNREVIANPVTDGVTHYIAPLEDLGTNIWEVASDAMRSSWGFEIWGDFWVLTALTQDDAFMDFVRAGQVKQARKRAKTVGLFNIEILEIG